MPFYNIHRHKVHIVDNIIYNIIIKIAIKECLLLFSAELFVFQLPIQKFKE